MLFTLHQGVNCVNKELPISAFDPGAQTFWHAWKAKAEEREKKKKDGTKEKITVHFTENRGHAAYFTRRLFNRSKTKTWKACV